MEEQKTASAIARIEPPRESNVSTIMNGAGNGAFVFGMPFFMYDLYSVVVKGKAPVATLSKQAIFSTIVGSGIGAWFGHSEAKRIKEYRGAISEELHQLRIDVNAHDAAIKTWSDKVSAPAAPTAETVTR
jgi:hypothetical protein